MERLGAGTDSDSSFGGSTGTIRSSLREEGGMTAETGASKTQDWCSSMGPGLFVLVRRFR